VSPPLPGSTFGRVRVEMPANGVRRIVLARPEMHNAQDRQLLYELNDAFNDAMADDATRVVIVAADGEHFSSGHDLKDHPDIADDTSWRDFPPVSAWGQEGGEGVSASYAAELEIYVHLCWRWRNLPKPTIAQVQGMVIGGGLMVMWPCDLIIAGRSASFSDPVAALGVNGAELFVHPSELGHRKAKEMLFTGEPITADVAHMLGMVNHVVDDEELESFTLQLAGRVARQPPFALTLAKQAVNHALDAQGQWATVQYAFALHHLAHADNRIKHGSIVDPAGPANIRRENQERLAQRATDPDPTVA
jgi:enoyl-CoA hydratase